MATHKSKVFIGFEDELITQKYMSYVNFSTNKVGGTADWMDTKVTENPKCQLCGLTLPLIVQIYAPLDKSPYHRTLYIFGCVNPNCWNQKESWTCLRSQLLDTSATESTHETTVDNFGWCEGADDWEDEQNGNVDMERKYGMTSVNNSVELSSRMAMLDVSDIDGDTSPTGARGNVLSPVASAEIEEDEDEMVTIDTPTRAQINVAALLDQAISVPQVPPESLLFESFFISVAEEDLHKSGSPLSEESRRSCTQLQDESQSHPLVKLPLETDLNTESFEKYEKTLPPHGDKLFHQFITRIQRHRGQILRYIRDGGSPLFLYPAKDMPQRCGYCGGELVFELQLLSTLISRLRLVRSGTGHMDFGTVLILTCKQSCWSPDSTLRSEHVLVQRELFLSI